MRKHSRTLGWIGMAMLAAGLFARKPKQIVLLFFGGTLFAALHIWAVKQ